MPVLATWNGYTSYVDANGFSRVIWQVTETGQIIFHKFNEVKSLVYMNRFFDKMRYDFDGVTQEIEFTEEDESDFAVICAYIRSHPSLTLSQWNTYLNTLDWQKRAIFKAYLYKLALKLAEHYGVTLTNYTETVIWTAVRNWIVNTNLNTVKRVIFGYLITL
jgi:hypothetical protein